MIFYREANKAAAGSGPNTASFETCEQQARSLKSLTRAQRSDAVNTDWLLKLLRPAHQAHPQICDLFVGPGASLAVQATS